MPPTFESNHEANKFTARLLLHHFLSKENMEWLALYASFDLTNEQKLALVFVREVGAIDNATYRQLDSSITHARARLEIHKLCDLGFVEKKGQGRNTYYIRTSKVVSLDERLRPQDEKIPPQHGTLGEKIPPQGEMYHGKHGTLGEMYHGKHGTLGEMYHGKHGTFGERYQGENVRYQGGDGTFEANWQSLNRIDLLNELPDELKSKIENVGKRILKEDLNQIIIALCSIRPYSIEELTVLLNRNPKSFKNFNIKALLETKRLFYWIPEMIRHPQQKYVAEPSMVRSNNRNN